MHTNLIFKEKCIIFFGGGEVRDYLQLTTFFYTSLHKLKEKKLYCF